MIFEDSIEALKYLLNDRWDKLPIEEREKLRDIKKNLNNHNSVSVQKAEEVLSKFAKVEKKITFAD